MGWDGQRDADGRVSYTAIGEADWNTRTPDEIATITAAKVHAVWKQAREIVALLRDIRGLMNSLGADGLHDLIREASRRERVRTARRRRRDRERKARARAARKAMK